MIWPAALAPAGSRIYAIGDIHGRFDLLERMLEMIAADAGSGPPERLVVVFLGDMIDRGPGSRQVVERIAAGPPAAGPLAAARWLALRGNHEDAMLRFLADGADGESWLRNGGLAMVRCYAGPVADAALGDQGRLRSALAGALPPDHLAFLAGLPLCHVEGDYFLVHAGVRPGIALDGQDPSDLMWIRHAFLESRVPFGKVVVHGHSVVPSPEIHPNRIAIDTGAWRSGRLTALVLEGAGRRFLTAEG